MKKYFLTIKSFSVNYNKLNFLLSFFHLYNSLIFHSFSIPGGFLNQERGFRFGEVPERPKGTDCKSVGDAFGGSNPPLSTRPGIRRSIELFSLYSFLYSVLIESNKLSGKDCSLTSTLVSVHLKNGTIFNLP
jgi:hypothetical protein